jgi:hypothetical protein
VNVCREKNWGGKLFKNGWRRGGGFSSHMLRVRKVRRTKLYGSECSSLRYRHSCVGNGWAVSGRYGGDQVKMRGRNTSVKV